MVKLISILLVGTAACASQQTRVENRPDRATPVRVDTLPSMMMTIPKSLRDQTSNAFYQLSRMEWPGPNRYRSADGTPGPDYWQQRADYRITATLDTTTRSIAGSVQLNARVTGVGETPLTFASKSTAVKVSVKVGDAVSAGQVLVEADSSQIQTSMKDASSRIDAANAQVETARQQAADKQRTAAQQQQDSVSTAQDTLQRAQADLATLELGASDVEKQAADAGVLQAQAGIDKALADLANIRLAELPG